MTKQEIQEANDRLIARRTAQKIETPAIEAVTEKFFKNLRVVSNEEADARLLKKQEAVKSRRLALLWNACNCPERLAQRKEFEPVKPWINTRDMITRKIGTGFLFALIGDRGLGKGQIAEQTLRAAVAKERSCYYVTATGLFCEIKRSYSTKATITEGEVIERFQRYKLLVIDEVGRRAENDWEDRILYEILDGRYRELRDTLLISNQNQTVFEKSVGESIVSRLNECGGIVEAKLKDENGNPTGWKSFRE